MKSRSKTGFSAIFLPRQARKINCGKDSCSAVLFSAISCVSRAMLLLLAVWIFAVVSVFAESYPNRPTAYDLEGIMILGKECVLGVNERCWATQYQTNSVAYRVAPFTNDSCWYLDKSLMGTMASKIRSLTPYYVNPDTIYNGTTNITMLTVTGVWAELEIGDHTNKFTLMPASGTNAATYGDNPWKIYPETLDERYDVLDALEKRLLGSYAGTSFPEVVRTATAWGQGSMATGGCCRVWYSLGGTNLGSANGTEYNIEIDTRGFAGQGGADYISLGWGGVPWGFNSDIFQITLDTSGGSGISTFSAGLTLDADPSVIKIWNCMLGRGASDPEDTTISYNDSGVEVSADLNRTYEGCAGFGIYGVINFPFQYCK